MSARPPDRSSRVMMTIAVGLTVTIVGMFAIWLLT
ncbi:hypothetical protein AEGHOMDF_0458 [Methylobacterium soli]|nr:hypothetical protein AEGHOMDF_0458 [Methylobacterium soli]